MKCQLILALVSSVIASKCAKPAVRREVRDLSEFDLKQFIGAVNALHNEKDASGMSSYDNFTKTYIDNMRNLHQTPYFLPWHRAFLRNFERELHRVNPNVTLPYWDWSVDSQAPHTSPVLSPMFFGSTGNQAGDYCITDGPFSNWTMAYPTPHCLRRSFDEDAEVSPMPLPESIFLSLNEPKYSDFSQDMEIKQSYVHTTIGGYHGDLTKAFSPNDPLFYLHHTFIDMLWAKWQHMHPDATQFEGLSYHKGVSPSDKLAPFTATVAQTLDTRSKSLCYVYPEYPSLIFTRNVPDSVIDAIEKQSTKNPIIHGSYGNETLGSLASKAPTLPINTTDKSENFDYPSRHHSHARAVEPLPISYIRDNDMDLERVRSFEANEKTLVNYVNENPDFVSHASLQARINRYYV
ncbi:hypothetical protein DSO57_1026792 [Entomophthora muscae]|uniref:Uncharacterized protein n=1 Tax=Entomophthora muscae TaxID=34485 RepID=A0ACC2U0B8_9FUNG|nr:hypothetical protein DSO57_1026792 [Entomophthora muscae]